ncbi:MAG: hypothetical protein J6Q17_02130, partial [Clostridia bacterium]|nr:hypothetical protein [Clostridia bacterium]
SRRIPAVFCFAGQAPAASGPMRGRIQKEIIKSYNIFFDFLLFMRYDKNGMIAISLSFQSRSIFCGCGFFPEAARPRLSG